MNAPLHIQIINSLAGKPEYVLIPVRVYDALREEIEDELAGLEASADKGNDYAAFDLKDYVDNPIALARIKADVTQAQLAKRMGVSQAYISKIEHQDTVTPKLLAKVRKILLK